MPNVSVNRSDLNVNSMYTVLKVQYNEAVEFIGVSEDAYLSLGGCWLGGGWGDCGWVWLHLYQTHSVCSQPCNQVFNCYECDERKDFERNHNIFHCENVTLH